MRKPNIQVTVGAFGLWFSGDMFGSELMLILHSLLSPERSSWGLSRHLERFEIAERVWEKKAKTKQPPPNCLDHLLSSHGWGVGQLWNLLFVLQAKELRGLALVCFVSILKCYFKKDLGEHSFEALLANSVIWQLENNDEFHTHLAVGRNENKVTGMLLNAGSLLFLAFCSWSAREIQMRTFPIAGSRTHRMAEESFFFSSCVCVFLCVHTCTYLGAGGCHQVSSSITFCLIFWDMVSLNLEFADWIDWLFSVDRIPRHSINKVKQQQQKVSLILMGATKLFLRLVSPALCCNFPFVSVFPYIHSPSSKVTLIFLIFVNQLVNKYLIIVFICIPLIANEVEQLFRFFWGGPRCAYLHSLFSESKTMYMHLTQMTK